MNFYTLIAEFCSWSPKSKDPTYKFFVFLETKYPAIWEELNKFYADDYSQVDTEYPDESWPRLHLYGWDQAAQKGEFSAFLSAFKSVWSQLSRQDFGKCEYCGKETELDIEHNPIVSWEYVPIIKFYEAFEMDGSYQYELNVCRPCAIKRLKNLATKADEERVTLWV